MRPLKRRALKKTEVTSALKEQKKLQWNLLETYGDYCSYCEMPVGQLEIEHHKQYQKWQKNLNSKHWKYLLLICHDCRHHLTEKKLKVKDLDNFLWPDKDLTFSLHSKYSPFLYEKILIEYTVMDGKNIWSQDKKYFVEIKVNPKLKAIDIKKAKKTIDLFQLNTPYFSKKNKSILIPLKEHLQIVDNRANQRLKTWDVAVDSIRNFKEVLEQNSFLKNNPAILDQFKDLITMTAKAKGNWSIWMTVFWKEFKDKELVTELFVENIVKDSSQLHFPGTHKEILKYE